MKKLITANFISALLASSFMADSAESYRFYRAKMVEVISENVIETASYTGVTALSPQVVNALKLVPRHKFVPDELRNYAYENRPLPIGHGQTISQPYIVAIMTDLLELQPEYVVLEIGTGSGYQAAVLSVLVDKVYSIEIIPALAQYAADNLQSLNYNNVIVRSGDGYKGWPEVAPFDSIIVTAGGKVPPALLSQLKPGGKMIIPVGNEGAVQSLTLFEKNVEGQLRQRQVLPVRVVPLVEGDNSN